MKSREPRKRRWGDRYDGFRIRNLDPMFTMIPYIMRSRTDSQVMFEEKVDITALRSFIIEQRKENIPELKTLHVILAAIIRTAHQKPRINRFISGGKIFARSYLRVSMAVKREMKVDGDEAIIIPVFDPKDTLLQVVSKYNEAISEISRESDKNDTDIAARLIGMLPGFVKRFIVALMRSLDSIGKMPKAINRLSPFHSSFFITNMGSIGVSSVYHHLYEFGTTSVFIAIGKRESQISLDREGNPVERDYMTLRFVADERICDGYYYASAIRLFIGYLKNPKLLVDPPEEEVNDY